MSTVIDTCDLFNFDIGTSPSYMDMDTPNFSFMSKGSFNELEEPFDIMDFYSEVSKDSEPFGYLEPIGKY